MKFIFLIFSLLMTSNVFALKMADKELKDSLTMQGKELVLNGAGIRKATIFNVKVYVAGLYTKSKSNDPKKILDSTDPKYIIMHFLRDVDKDKISGAWSEAFENNKDYNKDYKASLNQLNALMKDMKKSDTMAFYFDQNKVKVTIKNQDLGEISGKNIDKLLLAAWLGNPIDEQLKDGLLGKK